MSVTYTSTSSFLDSPLCSHFITALSSQLPIRNVPYNRTTYTLPTRLLPLADELLKAKHKPETRHLVQQSLLERPFAHVFLVATADSDLYRTQIRSEIRAWLTTLKETPTLHAVVESESSASGEDDGMPEYLIVYITPPSGYNTASSSQGYFASHSPSGGTPSAGTPAAEEQASTPKSGINKFLSSSKSSTPAKDPTGGVLEKLRTDFATSKKTDRILHISRLPPPTATSGSVSLTASHVTDPTIFTPLTSALKTSLAHTFEMAIMSHQAQATKLKALRNVRGWNPVNVFGNLECLANTLESVGLYDDAIQCFDDIDVLYKECLRDGELTFFPSITPTSLAQGQDSSSILSANAKPYRDMILHSSASIWDLKLYLLSRRLMLLSKMGRGIAIMRETMAAVGEMTLMARQQDLPPHCLPAFVFSACLDVLHHCTALFLSPSGSLTTVAQAKSIQATLSTPKQDLDRLPAAFHSMTSDLLLLAMSQLDRIGVGFDYLPAHRPFTFEPPAHTRETTGIASSSLLVALADDAAFIDLYLQLARRVLDCQTRSNKTRGHRALTAKLACLDMHRGNTQQAYESFCELIEGQSAVLTSRWNDMEGFLLRRQLECHARLEKPKNRQWVASIVNLLRTTPSDSDVDDDGDASQWTSESALFQRLHKASWDFEREVPVSGFTKLSVVAASTKARTLGDQDGIELAVHVFSALSQPLEVDDVRFCLIGGADDAREQHLWLTSGPVTLEPNGKTRIALRSYHSSTPGKYILDVSQIRFGKVVFQSIAPKALAGGASSSSSSTSTLSAMSATTIVTVPCDGHALQARLEQPKRIALDQARCGELVIETGRNHVTSATVRVKHPDSRPLMGFGAAEVIGITSSESVDSTTSTPPPPRIESTPDGLAVTLTELPAHHTITLRFPLHEAPPLDGSAMQLQIEVDYHSRGASAKQRRTHRTASQLVMALPLGVNVQDFFRLSALFCKFSISTGGGGALKVRSAVLKHADAEDEENAQRAVTVTSASSSRETVITPRQPASFVFQMRRNKRGAASTSSSPLRLFLSYRTLHEDAQNTVRKLAHARLETSSGIPANIRPLLLTALATQVEETLDVPLYALTGAIRFGTDARRTWSELCRTWDIPTRSSTSETIWQFVQDLSAECRSCGPSTSSSSSTETWRTLEIPVEVPTMEIINRIHLSVRGAEQLHVGMPLRVQVIIVSSFAWSGQDVQPTSTSTSTTSSLGIPSRPTDSDDNTTDAGSVFQDALSDVTAKERNGASPSPQPTAHKHRMSYEIQADFENWLVSGSKRGVWTLSASQTTHRVEITLVPLKAGSLTLPNVTITPLAPAPSEVPPSLAHYEGAGVQAHTIRPACETYVDNVAQRVRVFARPQGEGKDDTGSRGDTFWVPDAVVA